MIQIHEPLFTRKPEQRKQLLYENYNTNHRRSADTFTDKEQHMGRPAYPVNAFRRASYVQSKFRVNTLEKLRSDSNLRLICGFKKVPSLSTFCRRLNEMAETKEADCLHKSLFRTVLYLLN
jgi:hypothetical protein